MKQLYMKQFLKRFVIYPAVVGFISFHVLSLMEATHLGEVFLELGPIANMENVLNVSIPFESVKFLYLYAVGFVYGTMSAVFPVHKLGLGVIGLVLMYLKLVMSMFAFAPFAFLLIPVELTLVLIYFAVNKYFKKSKKEPVREEKRYTLKELKEWANETA